MADLRISQLPAADALTGTELVPVVQSGITKRTTAAAFGSGGAHPTLIFELPQIGGFFDGVPVNDWGDATVVQASADAHFDDATNSIVFDTAGIYRISIRGEISGNGVAWPLDCVVYGSRLGDVVLGYHARTDESAYVFMPALSRWTDEGHVVAAANDSAVIGLYARGYSVDTEPANFVATVYVQRVSP
jgi:hypothetical protein